MIRPEQMPDKVVEAVARYLCIEDGVPLEDVDVTWPAYEQQARAALTVGLAAWPGAHERTDDWCTPPDHNLILPLTQENNND
jgi:hypothetical protein